MRSIIYTLKKYFFTFNVCIFTILMSIILTDSASAQNSIIPKRKSLSLEIGNWQPNTINNEPSFDTFGKAGATPYMGVSFYMPVVKNLGVELSAAYWSLRDVEKIEQVHSLIIHPVRVDIKYWLVPDSFLSAYVIYGGGVYWGVENEIRPLGSSITKARAGWGCDLGAGFDIAFTSFFGMGISCTYLYVTFNKKLAGVDDFSGPKISGVFYFYL
ncbi:MAG: hypothetical protein R6V04_08690 [bacterium]